MPDRNPEKELEGLQHEYEKEGVSPSLLVRTRSLETYCHRLFVTAGLLAVEIVKKSPIRKSLQAMQRFRESALPSRMTTDIVEDLKRAIIRIDSAEVSLLVGLGEIAQRVMEGDQAHNSYSQHIVELGPRLYCLAPEHFSHLDEFKTTDRIQQASAYHPEWARDILLPIVRKMYPEARLRVLTTRLYLDEDGV